MTIKYELYDPVVLHYITCNKKLRGKPETFTFTEFNWAVNSDLSKTKLWTGQKNKTQTFTSGN